MPARQQPEVSTARPCSIGHVEGGGNCRLDSLISGIPARQVAVLLLRNVPLESESAGTKQMARNEQPVRGEPDTRGIGRAGLSTFSLFLRHATGVRIEQLGVKTTAPDVHRPMRSRSLRDDAGRGG